MKKELKTLKDIDGVLGFIAKGNFSHRRVGEYIRESLEIQKNEIKAEAVKWIKELQDFESVTYDNFYSADVEIARWIKHFFNLTEDDLK